MVPRRPVLTGGVSARTPRLTAIEPFEQDISPSVARPSPRHIGLVKRVSLSTMQFGSAIPSAELLTVSLSSGFATSRQNGGANKPSPSPPGDCLASLRAKTLLDYEFMREFALAKRKPVEDRNLSRMSASSVYSMRMAQMDLADQAGRLQRLELPLPTTSTLKAEDDLRAAASTISARAAAPPHSIAVVRPPRLDFRQNLATRRRQSLQTTEDASSCFPTLWRPSEAAAHSEDHLVKLKYRQPQPPSSLESASESSSTSGPRKHRRHEKASSSRPLLITDGLSDVDQRKCHPASSVTAQHGYLQEQDLPKLLEETGYDRTELYGLWARFKALCSIATSPKGIDKDTFRRGIPQLSVEDQFFIDRVFDILDADGSGILEWQEFVEALSALEKGDVAKRVGFLFRVYDLNGDGTTIHRTEVMRFFLSSLLVETTDELVEVAKHFVGKIFDAVGCGDVDTMRIDDALRYMNEHPSADIYSLFGRTMVTKQRSTGLAASLVSARARPEASYSSNQ